MEVTRIHHPNQTRTLKLQQPVNLMTPISAVAMKAKRGTTCANAVNETMGFSMRIKI
jgi:hypothetical protein